MEARDRHLQQCRTSRQVLVDISNIVYVFTSASNGGKVYVISGVSVSMHRICQKVNDGFEENYVEV